MRLLMADSLAAQLCRAQQFQHGGQSNTALARKGDRFQLGTLLVAGGGKTDSDGVAAEQGVLAFRRGVLLMDDFGLPAAVRRGVGAEVIKKGVAAENAAVH